MKKLLLLSLSFSFLLLSSSTAIAQDSFEDYKRQQNQGLNDLKKEYKEGVLKSIDDYKAYKKKEEEAFKAFKKNMMELWGDYKERTKKDWVEYKDGGKTRSSVDFEKGKGRVEIIVDNPEEVEKAKKEMKKALVDTFNEKGSDKEFPMKEKPAKKVSDKPVLDKQLPIKNNTKAEKEKLAEKLSKEKTKTKKVKGADGKDRVVVYVDFDLAPDHLQKRAREFDDIVYNYAKQTKLSPSLIFAIIHTESYFNPLAKSPANAYGLMQVVPTSGGRDAYRKVHKKDGVPTSDYLFNPNKNVELGSAYLTILNSREFRRIKNPLTREYLSICAYNTGGGNVAKAYIGSFKLSKAIPMINAKSPEENYDHLVKNLPYKETQDYLKKVTKRKKMYEKWSKS